MPSPYKGNGIDACPINKVFNLEDQIPDNIGITNQVIQDAFNGGLRPAVYSVNGGFQAGQLRASSLGVIGGGGTGPINTATRQSALNNNGFLAYAVQVEEDIVNTAALAIRALSTSLDQLPQGAIDSLVDTQIDLSNIRLRDGVPAQQYVYRPPSNPDELRMVSISLFGDLDTANDQGLSYVDLRVPFLSGSFTGKSALDIRNLPFNSYFSVFYTGGVSGDARDCTSVACEPAIGSPSGTPLVDSIKVEIGNDSRDFIREEWVGFGARVSGETAFDFAGNAHPDGTSYLHQHTKQLRLLTKKGTDPSPKTFVAGSGSVDVSFDPRASADTTACTGAGVTCGASIPTGEFRVIPDTFGVFTTNAGDPKGFNDVGNDAGINRFYPLQFSALGDSTTSSNAGRQTSTCGSGGATACGTLKFNTIWDAFRINMDNSSNNPRPLPTSTSRRTASRSRPPASAGACRSWTDPSSTSSSPGRACFGAGRATSKPGGGPPSRAHPSPCRTPDSLPNQHSISTSSDLMYRIPDPPLLNNPHQGTNAPIYPGRPGYLLASLD